VDQSFSLLGKTVQIFRNRLDLPIVGSFCSMGGGTLCDPYQPCRFVTEL